MNKRNFSLFTSSLIFIGALSAAIALRNEFMAIVTEEPQSNSKTQKVTLNRDQTEILAFSNNLVSRIPTHLQSRIGQIRLIDNSLPLETRSSIELTLRQLSLRSSLSGDLRLTIEVLEQDESIYFLCALEVLKSKNRILEISDQMQKKTR